MTFYILFSYKPFQRQEPNTKRKMSGQGSDPRFVPTAQQRKTYYQDVPDHVYVDPDMAYAEMYYDNVKAHNRKVEAGRRRDGAM